MVWSMWNDLLSAIDYGYWARWLGAQLTVAAVVYPILKIWRVIP